jgi:hypothetical protein
MHGFVDRVEDPLVSDQFEQGGKLRALQALDDGSADLHVRGSARMSGEAARGALMTSL